MWFSCDSRSHSYSTLAFILVCTKPQIADACMAYKFLALWKDADPDIPILKQAKAEYAKLQ
jgi:hypothetical protein